MASSCFPGARDPRPAGTEGCDPRAPLRGQTSRAKEILKPWSFLDCEVPVTVFREVLAAYLCPLSLLSQIWFQNQRAKWRKQKSGSPGAPKQLNEAGLALTTYLDVVVSG